MDYMRIGFKKRVSLVILPVDDFTEQVITGSILRMYTEDGKRSSIRKTDGYHVFCDLSGETVRICVDSPVYQRQIVEISLGEPSRIFTLRMIPNANYAIPSGATCVRGMIGAGSRIRLFFPEQKKSYKLLYDYVPQEQGSKLALFYQEPLQLEGKTFCIRSAETEEEFFQVKGQAGEMCELEQPLQQCYKKIGTSIYPVYETYADAAGEFYLPIRNIPMECNGKCTCLIQKAEEKNETCRILVLTEGKENRIMEEE